MKKSFYSVEIDYICQLVSQTFKIPVRFLDKNNNILHEHIFNDIHNPFYSSKEEYLNELCWEDDLSNFPIIRSNKFREKFILIYLDSIKSIEGTIIVGPSISFEPLEKTINEIIKNSSIEINTQKVVDYYHSLSYIPRQSFIDISVLLYYLIYLKKINASIVLEKNPPLINNDYNVENPDLFISICHQNDAPRNTMAPSVKLFEAIQAGRKEELLKHFEAFPYEKVGVLSLTSELRNRKNQAIGGIVLATRYAIKGGLPTHISFALGDLFTQNVEKIYDLDSLFILIKEAFCTFAEYVNRYRGRKYSKTIITCQNYILKNIYEELSLQKLAHITNNNPSYLSTLFKKEVGIPLIEYIHREKVEEAKKLLILTDISILDISTWLNFNNQSYFNKIFKKYTLLTPKKYRDKYTIY